VSKQPDKTGGRPLDARKYELRQRIGAGFVVIEMERLEKLSRTICPNLGAEVLPEFSDAWWDAHAFSAA